MPSLVQENKDANDEASPKASMPNGQSHPQSSAAQEHVETDPKKLLAAEAAKYDQVAELKPGCTRPVIIHRAVLGERKG